MLDLLRNLAILLVFAWLARSLLGTREITWRRTILATVLGLLLGSIGAAALLVRDLDTFDAFETIRTQFYLLMLVLAVPATMALMVFFELMRSTRDVHRRFRPFRTLKRWFRMWARGFQVTRIATRHGIAPLLGFGRGEASARTAAEIAKRTRLSLEEAGGMFVKLGQLLVTRPDLLPPEAVRELSLLHADVPPIPKAQVEAIVLEETGSPVSEVFAEITWVPLGSASIGQAHAARLVDGREVVVKVRRPGLEEQVETDLAIVRWLADVAERRTGWGKAYNVTALASEFSAVLRGELRFSVEAKYAIEIGAACAGDPLIQVPAIVEPLTTDRMLVMERMFGTTLSRSGTGDIDPGRARELADALCRSQVSAMLHGKRFHGDPHPGNVLMLDEGSIGLIDFGITGRLDAYERAAVYEVLLAMRLEQPALLYDALTTVGAITSEHDPDEIERHLAQFLTSLTGPGYPGPEALTGLLRLTAGLGMHLPPSTTTMFRAVATLAGTLETLSPRYPIFEVVADIGGAEMKERMQPSSASEFILQEWAEFGPLLRRAPRHLDRVARLAENGHLTARVRLFAFPEEVRTLERLLNRFVLTLLTIGLGGISVVLLTSEGGPIVAGVQVRVFAMLGWAIAAFATLLLLRILLGVLRSEQTS
ncbi:MAG TPA: AarF/UbiB family protein [Acidimicrobiia bacterium]|nr:AarF/UbiB family protein [Acidimicrobiia bacterium]